MCRISASCAFAALLSACTVGPDYRRPVESAPTQWQAPTPAAQVVDNSAVSIAPVVDDAQSLAAWWRWFDDPLLNELVEEGFRQNLDVRAALARVHLARADRRSVAAGGGPALGLAVGADRQQNPLPGLAEGLAFSLYEAGFDARWELDIFGRQRRRVEAAEAGIAAALEDQRGVFTLLCAEIARAYWEMRSAERLLTLAENSVRIARESGRLQERLVDAGLAGRQDALGANATVAAFSANTPALRMRVNAAQRQLELLLGRQPGHLAARLTACDQPLPQTTLRLLLSPAAVLRNRPDIQQAERQLAAATALKAAAIADQYPRVSLGVFFGLRSTAIGMLFSAISKSWHGGGTLLTPIFDAGRLRAAVDSSDARVEAALISFEKTMLVALHETELALTRLIEFERQREAAMLAVADLREATKLVAHRKQRGISTQLDVLQAEQAVNKAEIAWRRAEAAVTTETIAVLKALGAGVPRDPSG
jgi:NodT family efflux transporter outer membrane factor (OMF) lipoprotein